MQLCNRTNRNIALVLAAVGWIDARAIAQERFITQPKSRPTATLFPLQQPVATSISSEANSPISETKVAGIRAGEMTWQPASPSSLGNFTLAETRDELQWKPSSTRTSSPLSQPAAQLLHLPAPPEPTEVRAPTAESPLVHAALPRSTAKTGLMIENKFLILADSPPKASASPSSLDDGLHLFPEEKAQTEKPHTASAANPEVSQAPRSPKAILASTISRQILAGEAFEAYGDQSAEPIDAPPGWQAVGSELRQRIHNCESLLNRKAYYSAREEAEAAMLYLVRVLDLIANQYRSEPAWNAARRAMGEAEDFSTAQRLTSDSDFLRRLILSHETPVLKKMDVQSLAPLAAAQHYRRYAVEQLQLASQEHPWASEVLYALGRTYQAQADQTDNDSGMALRWKAVTFYRSAHTVSPHNSIAANQLGFVLLQMDRAADAREVLLASLHVQPSTAALENLIEASRRLGDTRTANWAMNQHMAMGSATSSMANAPPFIEVDPRTFAAISPYTIGPTPQHDIRTAPTSKMRAITVSTGAQ